MTKSLVKRPHQQRRAARLSQFCKEVKRALMNLCLDNGVPIRTLDFFIQDLFMSLEIQEAEFDTPLLLDMLLDEEFVYQTFLRFSNQA